MLRCAPRCSLPARTLSVHVHAHRHQSSVVKRSSRAQFSVQPFQCHRSRNFLQPHSYSQHAMDPNPPVNDSADAPPFMPKQLNWIDQLITSRQSQSLQSMDSELPQSSSTSRVLTSATPHALTMTPSQCDIGPVLLVLPAISK